MGSRRSSAKSASKTDPKRKRVDPQSAAVLLELPIMRFPDRHGLWGSSREVPIGLWFPSSIVGTRWAGGGRSVSRRSPSWSLGARAESSRPGIRGGHETLPRGVRTFGSHSSGHSAGMHPRRRSSSGLPWSTESDSRKCPPKKTKGTSQLLICDDRREHSFPTRKPPVLSWHKKSTCIVTG